MAANPAVSIGYNKGLPQSRSTHDFWERGIKVIRGTKVLVEQAKNAKLVLGTSRGRDKICSIIQYAAQFVYVCNVHSNIPSIQQELK